ncbi:MAG: hypothetical protein ACOX2M_06910 [Fastidiosipilaceae bacterium]|jgi:hypothetical protein
MGRNKQSAGTIAVLLLMLGALLLTSLMVLVRPSNEAVDNQNENETTTSVIDIDDLPEDIKQLLIGSSTTTSTSAASTRQTVLTDKDTIQTRILERGDAIRSYNEQTKIKQLVLDNGEERENNGEIYMDIYPQVDQAMQVMGSETGEPIFLMRYKGEIYRSEGDTAHWEPYEPETGELTVIPYAFFVKLATHPLMELLTTSPDEVETQADPGATDTIVLGWTGYDAEILAEVQTNYGIELTGFPAEEITLNVWVEIAPDNFDILLIEVGLKAEHRNTKVDVTFSSILSNHNNLRELAKPE